MAKILFLPYSHQLGSTYGLVDLAVQFKKLGDKVVFAGEGKFLDFARAAGFEVLPLVEIPFIKYRKVVDGGNLNFHDEDSLKLHIKEELALYKKVKPDLIISQARPSTSVSSTIAKINHVQVSIAFLTNYYGLKMEMPETFSGYFLTKIPGLGKLINNNMNRIVKIKAKINVKTFNKVAKEYGLPPYGNIFDLYSGNMLTLIPENSDLFPLTKGYPKDKFVFTGPLLQYNQYKIPDWYEESKTKDGNFIYLSMGSSSNVLYPIVLQKLIEIYGNKPNFYLITNTCFLLNDEKIKNNLPTNFFVTDTAPAQIMLKLADVTICHGGKGTIYHSLLEGVPIFGIPQQAEQEFNLKRVKDLGLGDYVLASKIKNMPNEEFEKRINHMIFDKEILKNVVGISDKIRKEMVNIDLIVEQIHKKINK